MFAHICDKFGWTYPYIEGLDYKKDLLRLVLVVDYMGHEKGLARSTVTTYLSNIKHHYTSSILMPQPPSPAWGAPKSRPALLTLAVKSVPEHKRVVPRFLTKDWIHYGFLNCWTTFEYVAIAFLYGWMLRVGEGTNLIQDHIVTWSMVTFYEFNKDDDIVIQPLSTLSSRPCYMVMIAPHSRKKQDKCRPIPGRVNFTHLADPATGIYQWCNLCICTLLQGWAIRCGIWKYTTAALEALPVLAAPGSGQVISAAQISQALKRNASLRGERTDDIVPKCLRRTPITQLANSSYASDALLMSLATGHKDPRSTQVYIEPGEYMAQEVTDALDAPYHPLQNTNINAPSDKSNS